MTTPAPADLAGLIAAVVEQLRADAEIKVYPLAEVAEITGVSLSELKRDCSARAPRLRHVRRGNLVGMTRAQIIEMIDRHTKSPETPVPTPAEQAAEELRRAAGANPLRARRTAA